MDTTSSAALTGVIVTTGTWAEGKKLSSKIIVGSIFLAIGYGVLNAMNSRLAEQFALLVLVGVTLRYFMSISTKLGLTK